MTIEIKLPGNLVARDNERKSHFWVGREGHWLYIDTAIATSLLPILQRFVDTGSIEERANADHPFKPQEWAREKCIVCNGLLENHAMVCDHEFQSQANDPSKCAVLVSYRCCGRPMEQHVVDSLNREMGKGAESE